MIVLPYCIIVLLSDDHSKVTLLFLLKGRHWLLDGRGLLHLSYKNRLLWVCLIIQTLVNRSFVFSIHIYLWKSTTKIQCPNRKENKMSNRQLQHYIWCPLQKLIHLILLWRTVRPSSPLSFHLIINQLDSCTDSGWWLPFKTTWKP